MFGSHIIGCESILFCESTVFTDKKKELPVIYNDRQFLIFKIEW